MSIEALAVKFTTEAHRILVIAKAWELTRYPTEHTGHGDNTMEAAILMQLLHGNATNTVLNQYAAFTNISPRLTAHGRDLFLQMNRWFGDQGDHLAGSAYPENPGRYILANWSFLPPEFDHAYSSAWYISASCLLYMALCKLSPLCGLYEPLSGLFTVRLLSTVGLPPLAESPTVEVPAPVVYQPPRRRLY